jgi:hypothetical protein
VWLSVIIPVTCCYSWYGRKSAKEHDSTMVYEQLTASANRCWLWVENNWNHTVSKSQAPSCEIISKQEGMITTTIFTAFLRTLNSFTGMQCSNNYIVVRGQLCHSSAGYFMFMKCTNYIRSKNCPKCVKTCVSCSCTGSTFYTNLCVWLTQ